MGRDSTNGGTSAAKSPPRCQDEDGDDDDDGDDDGVGVSGRKGIHTEEENKDGGGDGCYNGRDAASSTCNGKDRTDERERMSACGSSGRDLEGGRRRYRSHDRIRSRGRDCDLERSRDRGREGHDGGGEDDHDDSRKRGIMRNRDRDRDQDRHRHRHRHRDRDPDVHGYERRDNERNSLRKKSGRTLTRKSHERRKRDESSDDSSSSSSSSYSSSTSSSLRDRSRNRKKEGKNRVLSSRSRGRNRERGGRSRRRDKRRYYRKRGRRSSSFSSSNSPSSSSSSSSNDSSSSASATKRVRARKKGGAAAAAVSSSGGGGGTTATALAKKAKILNERLVKKLAERGETLEEREERRAKRRAARMQERFGYTPEDNPFNDPNLHETFSWKKKEEKKKNDNHSKKVVNGPSAEITSVALTGEGGGRGEGMVMTDSRKRKQDMIFEEIDKVRKRRHERELHFEEMERQRAEESRMREQENFDEWARKEEEFHLQQQRQRSAIRLVEGRERPVDVLAKNLLLFGLTEEEKHNRAKVKYQEKYNALDELDTLEAELEEPHVFLRDLKLNELRELLADIDTFRTLEREAAVAMSREDGGAARRKADDGENTVLRYWDALHLVTKDEIEYVKTGGAGGVHASVVKDIHEMFEGQSASALEHMKGEVEAKLGKGKPTRPRFDDDGGVIDTDYWQMVLDQLNVHLAKLELSELHSKMLVRQLEKLEKRKEDLARAADVEGSRGDRDEGGVGGEKETPDEEAAQAAIAPSGVEPNFGNLEEELGLGTEVDLGSASYAWQDRYRPRKPRYFNRVKTGYDWNKYNQTHYDHDNPPPKTVQGYKFNIFYPDLIDKTKAPQYFLEPADSPEFCVIRFHAGPPYEDIAFKIINREWNRSRKRGFRCTFERGVLSLYFNFASHWYRR